VVGPQDAPPAPHARQPQDELAIGSVFSEDAGVAVADVAETADAAEAVADAGSVVDFDPLVNFGWAAGLEASSFFTGE
jgi:hypothetical protein